MGIVRRLLFAVASLLVALFGVEVIVRAIDLYGVSNVMDQTRYREELLLLDVASDRIFEHRPNAHVDLRNGDVRTDSRGLRGPELESPKPEGVRRVVFVGDSVVFGWGVEEEHTFVVRSAEELSERTGTRWQAVNAGHMFHDSVQELGVLREVGLAYEPDLVLLVFVDNDVVSTRAIIQAGGGEAVAGGATDPEARKTLALARRLGRLRPYMPYTTAALEQVLVRERAIGQSGSVAQAEVLGFDLEAAWAACRAALLEMRRLCTEAGARFAILDYYSTAQLAEFCDEHTIPYASIAFTDEEKARGIANSRSDAHANPLGHRLLTEHIVEALERLELVEGL